MMAAAVQSTAFNVQRAGGVEKACPTILCTLHTAPYTTTYGGARG